MKLGFFSLIVASLLSGSVLAQDCVNVALSVIPSCAQGCILNGAPSIGCQGTDFACQCQQQAALMAAVEGCVASTCPSASYQAVIDGASTVCDCASPSTGAGPSASVSGIGSGGSVPATVSATSTSAAGGSVTGAPTSAGSGGDDGSGYSYTSVSNVATASVVGAAPQATAGSNVMRYVVPVVMVGVAGW